MHGSKLKTTLTRIKIPMVCTLPRGNLGGVFRQQQINGTLVVMLLT